MAFRKSYVKIAEEDLEKEEEEDMIDYKLNEADFKQNVDLEDKEFENKKFGNKIVKREAVEVKPNEYPKINDNLLKFIEGIVMKNLRQNKVENINTRANDQNLKILEAKNKISLKSKNIKKKTKTSIKKISTKPEPLNKNMPLKEIERIRKNWIYVK